MKLFSTGEVARLVGVSLENLAYRERTGKVPRASRMGNGKRFYTESDIRRLKNLITTTTLRKRIASLVREKSRERA